MLSRDESSPISSISSTPDQPFSHTHDQTPNLAATYSLKPIVLTRPKNLVAPQKPKRSKEATEARASFTDLDLELEIDAAELQPQHTGSHCTRGRLIAGAGAGREFSAIACCVLLVAVPGRQRGLCRCGLVPCAPERRNETQPGDVPSGPKPRFLATSAPLVHARHSAVTRVAFPTDGRNPRRWEVDEDPASACSSRILHRHFSL